MLRSSNLLIPVCCIGIALVSACGDHGHGEHNFASWAECFDHFTEEGGSAERAARDCDEELEVTHEDRADCIAEHAEDVSAGVDQADIDEHCRRAFPGEGTGTGTGS